MLSGSVINNIVMCVSNIESSWNDVQEVLYNKSSIRISNVKDFSYRERSVRGRIRSLKQTAGELIKNPHALLAISAKSFPARRKVSEVASMDYNTSYKRPS